MSELKILRSGCAVAEYNGTRYSTKEVLENYCLARVGKYKNFKGEIVDGTGDYYKVNKHLGTTYAHTFVVMSVVDGYDYCKDFCRYVRRHGLGRAQKSAVAKNLNHTGYGTDGQSPVFVILYQPDHEGLTKWYQENFDSTYVLENKR